MKKVHLLLTALLVVQLGYSQKNAVPDIDSIQYGLESRQHLDIHLAPVCDSPRPIYIDSHFNGGNTDMPEHTIAALKAAGITTISWESLKSIRTDDDRLTCWNDAKLMLAWVHEHATEYNLDTTQIIIGGSSRGTIASWQIAHSADPDIKGLYMYNALPDPIWQGCSSGDWCPTLEVKASSPKIFMPYKFERGTTDIHDPEHGYTIQSTYTFLKIGDKAEVVESLQDSTSSDRYQFLVEFARSVFDKLPTKTSQAITFETLAAKSYGDASVDLDASTSAGLSVTFVSSNTDVATISGNTVTIVGAGEAIIKASQSGNNNYFAACDVEQILVVNKATLTVTAGDKTRAYGEANPTLTMTYAGFKGTDNAAVINSIPTISTTANVNSAPGSYPITMSGGSDDQYNFDYVISSLVVTKAHQTITFNSLEDKIESDAAFELTATSSADLIISYASSNTDVATISGNIVTIVGKGTTNITASQTGNDNYNPANDVVQTLNIIKANQVITFDPLPVKTTEDSSFGLEAVTSSNLTVSYASSNTEVATISGNIVTIVGAGTTNITASQAGNDDYSPANDVTQVLTVNEVKTAKNILLKLYPNPISEVLTIRGLPGIVRYILIDTRSQEILSGEGQDTFQLDVSTLPKGIYTLRLESSRKIFVRKVFKK